MKQISSKEYEKYQQCLPDQLHGRTLMPDGIRIICASFDYDPEEIGKHILEMLAKKLGAVPRSREYEAEWMDLEKRRKRCQHMDVLCPGFRSSVR